MFRGWPKSLQAAESPWCEKVRQLMLTSPVCQGYWQIAQGLVCDGCFGALYKGKIGKQAHTVQDSVYRVAGAVVAGHRLSCVGSGGAKACLWGWSGKPAEAKLAGPFISSSSRNGSKLRRE